MEPETYRIHPDRSGQVARIGKHYEILRIALFRAAATDWDEGDCNYMTIMCQKRADYRWARRSKSGEMLGRSRQHDVACGFGMAACSIALPAFLRMVQFAWKSEGFPNGWFNPEFCALAVFVQLMLNLTSRLVEQAFRWFADQVIYRRIVGYGVFPSRPIFSGAVVVMFFAGSYWAATRWFPTSVGEIQSESGQLVSDRESDLDKSTYFSAVTFSTLGYGDYHPTKWLQWVAATKSMIGRLMIEVFTVCLVRQFLRR